MKPKKDQSLADEIIGRCDSLKSQRQQWDSLWQDVANYVMPRSGQITGNIGSSPQVQTADLFNMTAIRANQILAAGQKDYLVSGRWFSFDAPLGIEDDAAKTWYRSCTEKTVQRIMQSNFHLELHEALLDRGGFGTACLFCEEGKRTRLNFRKFDVGTFSIAEDSDGMVDTVIREFELTVRQAVQMFGEDNCGESVYKAYQEGAAKAMERKFAFIHAIFPREDAGRFAKAIDGPSKPWASVYVNRKDRAVCREGGYDEMPAFVTRFLTWGDTPYGYSPSIEALPIIRQVNFIEKQMDALAEIAAFPRVLIPVNLEGQIDMKAGGITEFDPNAGITATPKEWATAGRYDVGLDRIKSKDEGIRETFHVDLFQMLKNIDAGRMTAYEVSQRMAEKVASFSPTFYRLNSEIFTPLLHRVFGILYRAGDFGPPPSSVIMVDGENLRLQLPEITLTSKLALAIKAEQNNAFLQLMQILQPIAPMAPEIIDNFDLDAVSRGISSNLAVPVEWQRPADDVADIRESRAQAQQAAQAAQTAPLMAKAAKDVSAASPDVREKMGL